MSVASLMMAQEISLAAPQWIVNNLWLIPAIPMLAAGLIALLKQPRQRRIAAGLSIGSLGISLLLAIAAFTHVLFAWGHGAATREVVNFNWFDLGASHLQMGWVLDPLAAIMLVMVTFVGLLIFIYSTGYMAHDENFTRFFCFLSLFAGGMLGVIANSLLLLFMCWEIVGLTSYLLIGFWYHKPSAAAAAKKAFLTTRIGDIFFLLGIVWLFAQTGTLLFYNHGAGAIEPTALALLLSQPAAWGLTAAGAIGLLIFAGAAGKSGQLPLHVWLPDAMEGPTPVSALIHAATMVAAGVYLVARVYPLMSRSRGRRLNGFADGHCLGWRIDGALRRSGSRCAKRHQAHSRLLHRIATGLHDGRPCSRRRCRRHVPSDHACLLQSAALPRRRFGDSWLPRGAGHSPHGRIAVHDAYHLSYLFRGHAGAEWLSYFLLRLLEQGRNHRRGHTLAGIEGPVCALADRRIADSLLHDAASGVCLLRPLAWRGHGHAA
jgi:hypothetical protein